MKAIWHNRGCSAFQLSGIMAIKLEGLADAWEMDASIRQSARYNGQLVKWPNPDSVGLPSMNLVQTLNKYNTFDYSTDMDYSVDMHA